MSRQHAGSSSTSISADSFLHLLDSDLFQVLAPFLTIPDRLRVRAISHDLRRVIDEHSLNTPEDFFRFVAQLQRVSSATLRRAARAAYDEVPEREKKRWGRSWFVGIQRRNPTPVFGATKFDTIPLWTGTSEVFTPRPITPTCWLYKRDAPTPTLRLWLHDVRRDVSWWRPVATSRGRGGADVHTMRV